MRQAIRTKISTEIRGYNKTLGDHNPAVRQHEIDNITSGGVP